MAIKIKKRAIPNNSKKLNGLFTETMELAF